MSIKVKSQVAKGKEGACAADEKKDHNQRKSLGKKAADFIHKEEKAAADFIHSREQALADFIHRRQKRCHKEKH